MSKATMNHSPYFTIILPTYNREKTIIRAIESVLSQTFKSFELLVIDDGSVDDTKAAVAAFLDDRVKYHYKQNEERNFARNRGIELAIGSYINFLDSDDYVLPDHLEQAYNRVRSREIDVLMQGFKVVDNGREAVSADFSTRDVERLPVVNNFHCSGAFIRRDCLTDVRFIESKVAVVGEDRCLWMQLAARYNFAFNNSVTSVVVEHEGRSIHSVDPDLLIAGKSEIIGLLKSDEMAIKYYKRGLRLFASLEWAFIANMLAQNGRHVEGREYTIKAIKEFPWAIMRKRTLAAIKNNYL